MDNKSVFNNILIINDFINSSTFELKMYIWGKEVTHSKILALYFSIVKYNIFLDYLHYATAVLETVIYTGISVKEGHFTLPI